MVIQGSERPTIQYYVVVALLLEPLRLIPSEMIAERKRNLPTLLLSTTAVYRAP